MALCLPYLLVCQNRSTVVHSIVSFSGYLASTLIPFVRIAQVGKGPRDEDPTLTDSSTVTTFTPSGGDNPVAMSYTSISLVSAEISRCANLISEVFHDYCISPRSTFVKKQGSLAK